MKKNEKPSKQSLKKFVDDDRWIIKGGVLKRKKIGDVKVCGCLGGDYDCNKCGGTGVIYG